MECSLMEQHQLRDLCYCLRSGCALTALQGSEWSTMIAITPSPLCLHSVFGFLLTVQKSLSQARCLTTFLAEPLLSAGDNKGKEQHLKPNKTHTPSSAFVLVAMGTPYMHRKRWSMQMSFLISSSQSFMLLVQQFDH